MLKTLNPYTLFSSIYMTVLSVTCKESPAFFGELVIEIYGLFISLFSRHSSMPSLEPYDNEKVLVNDVRMMLQNVAKAKGILVTH